MDAVGFAVTLTDIASSSGCSTENAVMEKSASRPCAVFCPSETNSARGVLLKYAVWKAVKSASAGS